MNRAFDFKTKAKNKYTLTQVYLHTTASTTEFPADYLMHYASTLEPNL